MTPCFLIGVSLFSDRDVLDDEVLELDLTRLVFLIGSTEGLGFGGSLLDDELVDDFDSFLGTAGLDVIEAWFFELSGVLALSGAGD